MSGAWREAEQQLLLQIIEVYRQGIAGKDPKEARHVTCEMAKELHGQMPEGRTPNAIYERLPYLDNLLAGVFEAEHYAKGDRHLYASLPRESKSRIPNLCNIRYAYNGAMREYLKALKKERDTERILY